MWLLRFAIDVLDSGRALRNAGEAIEAHHRDVAEVDSVVARLQRHAAMQPAA
jgi:hypothetical protein